MRKTPLLIAISAFPLLAITCLAQPMQEPPPADDPATADPMQPASDNAERADETPDPMAGDPMAADPMMGEDGPPAMDSPGSGVLSGPSISRESTTLVQRDFEGQFVRVQGHPEIAALALVAIDPERRNQAIAAASDRVARLGMLLVDDIDLLKESTDALEAGDRDRVREIQEQVYRTFDPELLRDPLLPEFEGILTPEELNEVGQLADEYWNAWLDWELRNRPNATDEVRARVENRLKFGLFQVDLTQAYNMTLRPYRNRMESIYSITEPTEEQREAMREIIVEFIRETRLDPTDEQRLAVTQAIYETLNDEQRMRLFDQALWSR